VRYIVHILDRGWDERALCVQCTCVEPLNPSTSRKWSGLPLRPFHAFSSADPRAWSDPHCVPVLAITWGRSDAREREQVYLKSPTFTDAKSSDVGLVVVVLVLEKDARAVAGPVVQARRRTMPSILSAAKRVAFIVGRQREWKASSSPTLRERKKGGAGRH
jgi:hypothetical protein